MRLSKRDWLIEGVRLLTAAGPDGLTIDALTQRLGVTKGSFYHHFTHMQAFIDEMLAFYESEGTLNVIAVAESVPDTRAKLKLLLDITLAAEYPSEVAIRAWAIQNARVRELQERIDRRRIDYMCRLCRELVGDSAKAESMAYLFYAVYVGGSSLIPRLDAAAIQQLYDEIRRLYLPD